MSINKILLFLPLFLICSAVYGQSNYIMSDDYAITIQGGSNLHNWVEKAGKASGNCEITWNSNGSAALNSLHLEIKSRSIVSTEGKLMNNKTYSALKAEKYPEITFTLSAPVKAILPDPRGYVFTVQGKLSIAGITKTLNIRVKAILTGHNKLTFYGTQQITMSDFGINPPKALFGMLVVYENLNISFKTSFENK